MKINKLPKNIPKSRRNLTYANLVENLKNIRE